MPDPFVFKGHDSNKYPLVTETIAIWRRGPWELALAENDIVKSPITLVLRATHYGGSRQQEFETLSVRSPILMTRYKAAGEILFNTLIRYMGEVEIPSEFYVPSAWEETAKQLGWDGGQGDLMLTMGQITSWLDRRRSGEIL